MCCKYQVKETKFGIFEREYEPFTTGHIENNFFDIENRPDRIRIRYKENPMKTNTPDTIILFFMK